MTPNFHSPFHTWELTIPEQATGYSLSTEQQAVIQNDIAEAAVQKLQLKYDPEHPLIFLQKEAELQGRILILQHLLDRSANVSSYLPLTNEDNLNQNQEDNYL